MNGPNMQTFWTITLGWMLGAIAPNWSIVVLFIIGVIALIGDQYIKDRRHD